MTRLELIKQRLEAATPGPWVWNRVDEATLQIESRNPKVWAPDFSPVLAVTRCDSCVESSTPCLDPSPQDAAFITHAREDIPWLIQEIKRLMTSIDMATERLECGDGEGAYAILSPVCYQREDT